MAFNYKAITKGENWADDEVPVEPEPQPFQNGGKMADYPTLGEAVKAPPAKKKNKGTKVDLATFNKTPTPSALFTGSAMRSAPRGGNDKDILMSLPTGSTGRVEGAEGAAPGLGGAFTGYSGQAREGGYRRKEDMDEMRAPRESELMGPSRAEEVDDWATTRKFVAGEASGGGAGGRSGGFGGGGGARDFGDRPPRPEGSSDAVEDWGKERKFEASAARPGASGGGGTFGDRPERRGYEPRPASKADDEDEWGKTRTFTATAPPAEREQRRGFNFNDAPSARPADGEDRWARRVAAAAADDGPAPSGSSGGGSSSSSAPAERPRLQIAARTKPIENPLPPVAPSAVPANGGSSEAAAPAKPVEAPKPRSNPFGAARPREMVLKEKGVDVIAMEAAAAAAAALAAEKPRRHEPVVQAAPARKESEEEKSLKAQVEELGLKLAGLKASAEQPEAADEEEDESMAQVAQDMREAKLIKDVAATEQALVLAERKLLSLVAEMEAEHAAAAQSAADAKAAAAVAKQAASDARKEAAEAKQAAAAAAAAEPKAEGGAEVEGAAVKEGEEEAAAAAAPVAASAPSKPRW